MSLAFQLPSNVNPGVTLLSELVQGLELIVNKVTSTPFSYHAGDISWEGKTLSFYSEGNDSFSVEELEQIVTHMKHIQKCRSQEETDDILTNDED